MEAIIRAFESVGSRAVITDVAQLPVRRIVRPTGRAPVITVDIARDRRGEYFRIGLDTSVNVHVMNAEKAMRHLLLFAVDREGRNYRYLCGHDERSWFAAAVPYSVSTVKDAMQALKPEQVIEAQAGLKTRHRNRRKNRSTLRQGEWFFIPVPDLDPHPAYIIRNEPIRRGGGSPHMVEEVYRRGGNTVFVCRQHPDGVNESEYNRLLAEEPKRRFWGWQSMTRDMEVYGRGKVAHRDHQTITLKCWHRILMNTESGAWFMAETLVFLD